jgi:hypothetical protein
MDETCGTCFFSLEQGKPDIKNCMFTREDVFETSPACPWYWNILTMEERSEDNGRNGISET